MVKNGSNIEAWHGESFIADSITAVGAPHGVAPRVYCAANPLRFTDPTGMDAVVLITSTSDGIGHLGMLIQNENGTWSYYSFNGKDFELAGSRVGGRTEDEIGVGCWDSPEEFLNSSYNTGTNNTTTSNSSATGSSKKEYDPSINGYGYKEGYRIPTTSKQDETMRTQFAKNADHKYGLVSYNCAIVVQKTLEAAGIDASYVNTPGVAIARPIGIIATKKDGNEPRFMPISVYRSVIEHNRNGRKIFKRK